MTGCKAKTRIGGGWLFALAIAALLGLAGSLFLPMQALAEGEGPVYVVSAEAGNGGTVSPEGASVPEGGSAEFTFAPKDGYQLDRILLDGVLVDIPMNKPEVLEEPYLYKFDKVTSHHAIEATFMREHTVEGLPSELTLAVGRTVTWTPQPAYGTWTGYSDHLKMFESHDGAVTFKALKAGKTEVRFITNGVSCNIPVTIVPAPTDVHAVYAQAGFGGTIEPAGESLVKDGEDLVVTVTPDLEEGYAIDQVLVDGKNVFDGVEFEPFEYTFSAVNGDHDIVATFKSDDTWEIYGLPDTLGLGVGKSVTWTPKPSRGAWSYENEYVLCEDNKDGSFTFTGRKPGTTTVTYTVRGKSHPIELTVKSALTITAVCSEGGRIDPKEATVTSGRSQTFTITPDPLYHIEYAFVINERTDDSEYLDVTDQLVDTGDAFEYTFEDVSIDQRLEVGFERDRFTVDGVEYMIMKEEAPGGVGAPGQNAVEVYGQAHGASIVDLVIPPTVTGNEQSPGTVYEVVGIKYSAFLSRTELESVDFSRCQMTNDFVGALAFQGCERLNRLVFGQAKAPAIWNAFYSAGLHGGTVWYPKGATGYEPSMFQRAFPDDPIQLSGWTFVAYGEPDAPLDLAAAQGDGKVDLAWKAPADAFGIQKYQYSASADGVDNWRDVPASGPDTEAFTVDGLENGTVYEFKVRAVNVVGEGEAASISAIPGVPAAPQSLAAAPGDGKVELSWDALPAGHGVVKFQYSATADGSDDWRDIPGSDGSTTAFTVDGLTNGTTYEFKVRAVNVVGEGAAAAVSAMPGAPGAPQNLVAAVGAGKVDLMWDALPAGFNVTTCQYSATSDGVESWKDMPGSGPDTTSFTVEGLENGTSYELKVRAVNAVGEGAAAAVSAVPLAKLVEIVAPEEITGIANGTPLADIPLPGKMVLMTESGRCYADVTWDRTTAKPAYDPASASGQTFAVRGAVVLPVGVDQNGVSLETSVTVTVKAKTVVPPHPTDPSKPKSLVRTGDTDLPFALLGIASLALVGVITARTRFDRR